VFQHELNTTGKLVQQGTVDNSNAADADDAVAAVTAATAAKARRTTVGFLFSMRTKVSYCPGAEPGHRVDMTFFTRCRRRRSAEAGLP
jgi:hypothetical protein